MKRFNCGCSYDCTGLAFVSSIIIGIITATLRYTAAITVTPAFLWVLFGVAVVYLLVTFGVSALFDTEGRCVCNSIPGILIGSLGTILTSIVLLAIEFVATSVIGAIITGALLLFFSLLLTSVACLIKCLSNCDE